MKRPNITPGPWNNPPLSHAVDPANGDLSICRIVQTPHDWHSIEAKRAEAEKWDKQSEANTKAIAALPQLLEALEGLMADKYLSDPINADRMAPAKAALIAAGYEF